MALHRNQRNNRRSAGRYLSTGAKWGIAAAVIALLAGALAAVWFFTDWFSFLAGGTDNPGETQNTIPPAEDTVIHFVAGGDINITDKVVASGASQGGYSYSDLLLDVVPVLSGADLTALNFEGNLYGEPYGTRTKSAPLQLITDLKKAGVDLLQTANSKSLTNGLNGLSATIQGIRQTGMQNLGTFTDKAEYERYNGFLMREINGIRIAFVAFTKGMDGSGVPAGREDCVNLLYTDYNSTYQKVDTEGITRVIKAASSASPDLIVAMLHWGSEYNDQISSTQKKIIKLMDSLGVDAIIGTHPHYVQKMGFHEDTGMFIAYSLGDFLSDGDITGTSYSVLLDLEITKDGKTGKTAITDYSYTPIYLYNSEESMQLLRLREAIAAYENNYIHRVPEAVYTEMKTALSRIESRVAK